MVVARATTHSQSVQFNMVPSGWEIRGTVGDHRCRFMNTHDTGHVGGKVAGWKVEEKSNDGRTHRRPTKMPSIFEALCLMQIPCLNTFYRYFYDGALDKSMYSQSFRTILATGRHIDGAVNILSVCLTAYDFTSPGLFKAIISTLPVV